MYGMSPAHGVMRSGGGVFPFTIDSQTSATGVIPHVVMAAVAARSSAA
jgi:hypothetical protein